MNSGDWWHLLAGIALFVFAMSLLEDSLKELAGRPFKKFLQRQTSNKFRAIAGGTIVTAFLQSSSVVLLMVLSFVGAGVMTMRNALAVTFGANLGTTLDSWVVATLGFKVALDAISYPVLAVALLIKIIFPANNNIRNLTHFIIGFALLFVGLEWMKASVSGLVEGMDMTRYAGLSPYLFIPIGIIFTGIIQSSSATVAITLTALYHHIIPFESAAAIVIGSELGTTLKIMLGSIGGTADKKRVSMGNLIFNIVIVVVATIFLYPLIHVIRNWAAVKDPLIALVAFQTSINVIGVVGFYPFLGQFATFLERLYRKSDGEPATRYINNADKEFTGQRFIDAKKEIARLMRHTIALNSKILGLGEDQNKGESWFKNVKHFLLDRTSQDEEYKNLKELHGEILEFLVAMPVADRKLKDVEQTEKLIVISRHIIHAAKNLKDIQHNIKEVGASSNDTKHELFVQMRDRERVFYETLEKVLPAIETGALPPEFETLIGQKDTDYKTAVDNILGLLNQGKITEIDASTLLNMRREIYSSHKALLEALKVFTELSFGQP